MGIPHLIHSTAQPIDLIDKNDAASPAAAGAGKQLPHPPCSHSREDLLELGGHHANEFAAGLIGEGPRQHSFAGAWRPIEEHASAHPGAHVAVLLGVLQEVNDLPKLGLNVFTPVDVVETLLPLVDLTTHIHPTGICALHLPQHEGCRGHGSQRPQCQLADFGGQFGLVGVVDPCPATSSTTYVSISSKRASGNIPKNALNHSEEPDRKETVCPLTTTSET